ncbi:MAG: DmsE family decaheme c-type cytochrome [Betaproteobacteria bacterium]
MTKIRKMLIAVLLMCGVSLLAFSALAQNNLPELNGNLNTRKAIIASESLKRDALCTKCHDESETTPILSLYQTKHGVRGDARTPNCQSCHGDSNKHIKGDPNTKGRAAPDIVFKKGEYALSDDKERTNQCLSCHKGEKRTNWDGGKHQTNGVACNDCHKVHTPTDKVREKKTQIEVCFTCHKEQRADSHKISSHPIQVGKMTCSDCHNPHGSSGPKMLKKNTVNETCYQCHAEKRGPVLFEHQPVVEDCANCHNPHGSNITPLLKSRPPFLCDECHDKPHASGSAVSAGAAGINGIAMNRNYGGRSCMNCHSQVHGSNSPGGGFFQR